MTASTEPAWVSGPVAVEVPATSANLGPGYDCLGLALALRDRLTAEIADELSVSVEGEGAAEVPRDDSHLVVRALHRGLDFLGAGRPGVRVHCENRIPHSRGLGSSSAAIVGGLALARALVVGGSDLLDDDALFDLANRIEGHPDNVAPATYGGFVVCGQADGEAWAVPAPVHPSVRALVFVPAEGVRTEVARGLIPATVPHAEAAADAARVALLVTALAHEPGRLLRATEDFLHQRYREPAMPGSLALVARLRGHGVPAVVSGAGPTVLAFLGDGLPDAGRVHAEAPAGWRVEELALAPSGVRTVAAR